MRTIVTPTTRLKLVVPVKCGGGNVYTKTKTCVTAKSAADFYANSKNYGRQQYLEHATGQQMCYNPRMWANHLSRFERQHRRALKVFQQYLP